MNLTPIREAVRSAAAAAIGLPVEQVQLETERGGHAAISRGRRLRFDFDARELGQDYTIEIDGATLDPPVDGLVEAVRGDREVGVTFRFECDEHTAEDAWAFALASRLAVRLRLGPARAVLDAAGISFLRTEDVVPQPAVETDRRQQSVASFRAVFLVAICELATDTPGTAADVSGYFNQVEVTSTVGGEGSEIEYTETETIGPVV